MRLVSRILEGTVALVFVFGLLGSLLTGAKPGARPLGRKPYTGWRSPEACPHGFAGAMGWDGHVLPGKTEIGSPPSRGRREARVERVARVRRGGRQTIRARRVLASAARRRVAW